ncbi:MAG TPA: hypothetical protein ENJ93_01710 [Chloroflexi bacterium]|nr:hypothetical protein [Chloroflexota bacterium]
MTENENGAETAVQTVDDEMLEAFTRLLVGALVEGSEQFRERLKKWDEATAVPPDSRETTSSSSTEQLRHTLIGAIFHAEAHLKTRQIPLFKRAAGLAFRSVSRLTAPVTNSRIGQSANGRMDKLAARGETFVDRWMATGRVEEEHGRKLALKATQESIDEFINYLSQNEELKDLITEQSMSLAAESMDSVRERTVTTDALAERFVRALLRRPPRTTLAPVISDESQNE